ncbi:RHS repeat domain-containing protein [Chryseobacterium sp. MYb328]|uniref:RHS repeat domain-containing protein n=1 Tax=Chryseobacterium sp. MYb328 TaxID=2745231 RepID=UPI0030A2F86A
MDVYGSLRKGNNEFVPFLYQGQYVDAETGLAYNRFRYYDSEAGNYISQDPIGLLSGQDNLYGYVKDIGTYVDLFGLAGTAWDAIDFFRDQNGMPVLGNSIPKIGDGKGTVAFVKVNGEKIFGINSSLLGDGDKDLSRAWRDKIGLGAGKSQVFFHAEAYSLMSAHSKFGELPSKMTLYVDRATCPNCQKYLPGVMKALGIKELEIIDKSGKKLHLH